MNILRYWRHVLLCWMYQVQQLNAAADLKWHSQQVRECADALNRATAAEVAERMAFEQYRRVMRGVAR